LRPLSPFLLDSFIATGVIVATTDHTPTCAPRVAAEKLKELKANRVLLLRRIFRLQGIPTLIDSRAQLYGSAFSPAGCEPFGLKISQILSGIDATLLFPSPQSVGQLDRLPNCQNGSGFMPMT
jgi:hypothetical protein